MADSLQLIFRGLNSVGTVGQARTAIGEALNAIGAAHELPGLTAAQHRILEDARMPLQNWYAEIKLLPGNQNYGAEFQQRRRLVERAYIEISGIGGVLSAKATVSLARELQQSTEDVARGLGAGARILATTVGETAGGIAGGLLSGLGPVVVIVLAIGIYFAYFRPRGA